MKNIGRLCTFHSGGGFSHLWKYMAWSLLFREVSSYIYDHVSYIFLDLKSQNSSQFVTVTINIVLYSVRWLDSWGRYRVYTQSLWHQQGLSLEVARTNLFHNVSRNDHLALCLWGPCGPINLIHNDTAQNSNTGSIMIIKIVWNKILKILFKSLKVSNQNGESDSRYQDLICSV